MNRVSEIYAREVFESLDYPVILVSGQLGTYKIKSERIFFKMMENGKNIVILLVICCNMLYE